MWDAADAFQFALWGTKEVNALNAELKVHLEKAGIRKRIDGYTVERQCNESFLKELDSKAPEYDCIVSMACGAGVQHMAQRFSRYQSIRCEYGVYWC